MPAITRRIEWRNSSTQSSALLAVETEDDANVVVHVWDAEPDRLADFLNDMAGLDVNGGPGPTIEDPDPERWGDLVIARAADGDVLFIDPELYWNGIADVFRSRGDDPHPWRGRS